MKSIIPACVIQDTSDKALACCNRLTSHFQAMMLHGVLLQMAKRMRPPLIIGFVENKVVSSSAAFVCCFTQTLAIPEVAVELVMMRFGLKSWKTKITR